MQSTCPYIAGSDIVFASPISPRVKARVVDIKTMTLSCVMAIQYDSSPDTYLLKLYDRRFAEQLRRDEEAAPWDTQIERRYRDFVRTGGLSRLFSRWSKGFREDQYWQDDQCKQWDQGTLETYLQFLCQKAYNTEKHAYNLMSDMQGTSVPRFYGEAIVHSSATPGTPVDAPDEYLDCPGMILQHIPGFPLADLAHHVSSQLWQCLCETAIDIIHHIGDRGICNRDVNTRSFIIREAPRHSTPQVFMVDFGLCVFREQAQNEHEFREWQADQDEEGAVGRVMERLLPGAYRYRRSERAQRLLADFKSEE